MMHFKDAVLDALADRANIAQFVSFGPTLEQRYSRVVGFERNCSFASVSAAAAAILESASDHSVNVRSFEPDDPKSREFVYGLKSAEAVESTVLRLAASGLFTIINETINIHDGGVSGVMLGDVIEFAPEDTPRCVEHAGTVSLPRELGLSLLKTVYSFQPALEFDSGIRVEFSLHPLRRGVRNDHTIIWELEDVGETDVVADIRWPNRFSRFIGDKAFGLLVADLLGLPVPMTTVIARKVAPFTFGRATGCNETWIRTCPASQTPGKFTTHRGWLDPYTLMQAEDPSATLIASILAQRGIDAEYSGAAVASSGADESRLAFLIEGTIGFGDDFMVGLKARSSLPQSVVSSVQRLYRRAVRTLGPVRMEWVCDQRRAWVVQFHRGATVSSGNVVVPGRPKLYRRFPVENGLEALRSLVAETLGTGDGIVLIGDVGITSHFGDVLRKAEIPSMIVGSESHAVHSEVRLSR